MNPDNGRRVWRVRLSQGTELGGIHWGMTIANGNVLVPVADPPHPKPGYVPKPGLYALSIDDGDMVWAYRRKRGCETDMSTYRQAPTPWPECSFFYGLSAAPTATASLVFVAALDGEVLALDTSNGNVMWRYDTARPFDTVNGIKGHGGSADNAGVQVADDMIFVNSGYSLFGQMPGNVLLAFRLDETPDEQ